MPPTRKANRLTDTAINSYAAVASANAEPSPVPTIVPPDDPDDLPARFSSLEASVAEILLRLGGLDIARTSPNV